jgi:hypothetical protein|tara:strand:+ start:744 stop:1118 length:375 start_codon:yes stop_codon:yes gene_type:complete
MENRPNVIKALEVLGKGEWVIDGELPTNESEFLERFSVVVGIDETDTTILSNNPDEFGITWTQINEKLIELRAEWDNKDYYRKRAVAYPEIADQLDMQYWDAENGTTTWKDAIEAVKAAHPKPS